MAQSTSEGTLLARLFIIAMALGLVVLGIYPIRSDIREMANKTRLYVKSHFPILTGDSGQERSRRVAASKGTEPRSLSGAGVPPEPQKPKGVVLDEQAAAKEKVDRLTPKDRKQLSDLVNSF